MTKDPSTQAAILKAAVQQCLTSIESGETYQDLLNGGLLAVAMLNEADNLNSIVEAAAFVDDNSSGITALVAASSLGHTETLRVLVEQHGAEVNHSGSAALYTAVSNGHLIATRYLLPSKGTNPFSTSCDGMVTIWAAATHADLENEDYVHADSVAISRISIISAVHDAMLQKVMQHPEETLK